MLFEKGAEVKDENDIDSADWVTIIPDSKTSADKEHEFDVKNNDTFSHIKVTIIPDGGVKRIRAFGVKA